MRLSSSCLVALACATTVVISLEAQGPHTLLAPLRGDADRLIKAATADDFAWRRLAELTDTFGRASVARRIWHARFSGRSRR